MEILFSGGAKAPPPPPDTGLHLLEGRTVVAAVDGGGAVGPHTLLGEGADLLGELQGRLQSWTKEKTNEHRLIFWLLLSLDFFLEMLLFYYRSCFCLLSNYFNYAVPCFNNLDLSTFNLVH